MSHDHDHGECDSCDSEQNLEDAPMPPTEEPFCAYLLNHETEVPGTDGKLFKTVLVEGTGTEHPPHGAKVQVHYVGTLESDGSKFDSSRDRNEPFEFEIGKGSVIKGWDKGVATMLKGEKAILKCLPEYAYGAAGSPPKIPANSTLHFEVELLSWMKEEDISEHRDKSLLKEVMVPGDKDKSWQHPEYEATVKMNFRITSHKDGTGVLYEKMDWSFVVGDADLPEGLEQALKSMKLHEAAVIQVAGSVITRDDATFKLTRGVPVFFHITMIEFENVKTYDFKGMDKVNQAKIRKDQGNEYFKRGDLVRAEKKYKRGVELVEYDYGLNDEEKAAAKVALHVLRSNLAQVYLNQKNYSEVIAQCNKVIEQDAKHTKALFRRGKAYNALDNWDDAMTDLKKVLELDAASADAKAEMAVLQKKISEHNKKEKSLFNNMFSKMSQMEEKEAKKKAAEEEAKKKAAEEEAKKKAAEEAPAAAAPPTSTEAPK